MSQVLTRLAIYRDRLVRALIPMMIINARSPTSFSTPTFEMKIGAVTDMNNVGDTFVFPSEFVVPADSPREPTYNNPTTALAYQFIEYKVNPYYWAPSNPVTGASKEVDVVITLLMFYADAREYPVCVDQAGCNTGNEFIRVFANYYVYSSGVCKVWDRFFEGSEGGAWSGRDIVNDGSGCLTLRLGDIGFFIDGRPSYIKALIEAEYFLSITRDRADHHVIKNPTDFHRLHVGLSCTCTIIMLVYTGGMRFMREKNM